MNLAARQAPAETESPTGVALVAGVHPGAQGTTGDAASTAALGKLSRSLNEAKAAGKEAKRQRKVVDLLKGALTLLRRRDFEGGAQQALKALNLDERSGVAWHVLAICREKAGHPMQALTAYEAAIKLLPAETDVAQDLGRLAQRLGYLDIAEKLLHRYLSVHPGDVEATNNLACVMRDQGRWEVAIDTLRDLIQVKPGETILWNCLGTVLSDQGDSANALTFFEEALRLDPKSSKARYNRANVRHPMGNAEGALEDIDAALPGAEPGYERSTMLMARALILLALGRLEEGWAEYEIRLDRTMPEAPLVVTRAERLTDDTPLAGRRLLIVGEQGIADEMVLGQITADALHAVGPAGHVYLAVDRRMVGLFQRAFPEATVGGHKAIRREGRLTRFLPFLEALEPGDPGPEVWAPMGSLHTRFRPALARFPDHDGYLPVDPERVARWTAELEALGPGLKVGLHWKSLVLKGNRARYFSSFNRWEPVLTTPGCVMVNLQCGDTAADLAEAEAAGVRIWTPPINLKDDLEDVAALSKALDVVIGPGIAGTNLAAATGARTWMIHAPDDWHLLGTDRYPFYPRMRLFPTHGYDGWPSAIARVRQALDAAVTGGWNAD